MASHAHSTPAPRRVRRAAAAVVRDRRRGAAGGPQHVRELLEDIVERALAMLDALDAAAEDREAEEDCCPAADDDTAPGAARLGRQPIGAGAPEDAEDDDPAEDGDEDCCDAGDDRSAPLSRPHAATLRALAARAVMLRAVVLCAGVPA